MCTAKNTTIAWATAQQFCPFLHLGCIMEGGRCTLDPPPLPWTCPPDPSKQVFAPRPNPPPLPLVCSYHFPHLPHAEQRPMHRVHANTVPWAICAKVTPLHCNPPPPHVHLLCARPPPPPQPAVGAAKPDVLVQRMMEGWQNASSARSQDPRHRCCVCNGSFGRDVHIGKQKPQRQITMLLCSTEKYLCWNSGAQILECM